MGSKKKTIKKAFSGFTGFMRSFFEQMNEDSAMMLSNGMVYSTLLAIVPCLAVIYAVLNRLGVLAPVVAVLEDSIMNTFGEGTGDTLVGYIRYFTGNAMGLGVLSILSFGLTFVLLIDKIYTVVNKIWHTPPKGKLIIRYLKYIVAIIIGLIGIALLVFLIGRFNSLSVKIMKLPELSAFEKILGGVIPIAVVFGLMLILTYLIPNCRVRFKSGLIGAISGTVGIMILTYVFKIVVRYSVKYSLIYGSLATLLFFFMFLSYLWKIIFSAMIISYVHQARTVGVEYEL
jgi:membrane protein